MNTSNEIQSIDADLVRLAPEWTTERDRSFKEWASEHWPVGSWQSEALLELNTRMHAAMERLCVLTDETYALPAALAAMLPPEIVDLWKHHCWSFAEAS